MNNLSDFNELLFKQLNRLDACGDEEGLEIELFGIDQAVSGEKGKPKMTGISVQIYRWVQFPCFVLFQLNIYNSPPFGGDMQF